MELKNNIGLIKENKKLDKDEWCEEPRIKYAKQATETLTAAVDKFLKSSNPRMDKNIRSLSMPERLVKT